MKLSALLLLVAVAAPAQTFRLSREQLIRYTAANPFDRYADGRPKVPDELLEQVKGLSIEEAWGFLQGKGYIHQYAGPGFHILHPGKKLVGRAVTAQYLPTRPDVVAAADEDSRKAGLPASTNQKVIDQLILNDVPVIDLMGAAAGHNFGGDNLHAAIYGATKTGAVVDGTIRDVEGIFELGSQVFFRQARPEAVAGVWVAGINIPVKIGEALVMPGDVVLGDRTGVVFIPPQFVKQIVEAAELTHLHDEWTKAKFLTGKYKSSELYGGKLSPEMQKEYDEFIRQRMGKK